MANVKQNTSTTKANLTLKPLLNEIMHSSFIKSKVLGTKTNSYDPLVGIMVLFPMGFTLILFYLNNWIKVYFAINKS